MKGGFRFHHVLVRDVAYAGLPQGRAGRAPRAARRLARRRGGDADELVGYHLEQAFRLNGSRWAGSTAARGGSPLDAGGRLGAAGIDAWKRGDTPATVNLLGRAIGLLPESDAFRLDLLCELGPALRTGSDLRQPRRRCPAQPKPQPPPATAGSSCVLASSSPAFGCSATRGSSRRAARRRGRGAPGVRGGGRRPLAGQSLAWCCSRPRSCAPAARGSPRGRGRGLVPLPPLRLAVPACLGVLAAALEHGPMPVPAAIRRCRKLLAEAATARRGRTFSLPWRARGDARPTSPRPGVWWRGQESCIASSGKLSTAEANCGPSPRKSNCSQATTQRRSRP